MGMACLGVLASFSTPAIAQSLTIVTSYPPAFFEPFRQAFEACNDDLELVLVQRNTASAVRFILERPEVRADLFWASSPDAFERLKTEGALRPLASAALSGQRRVAGYPVNDPDGKYVGFALSRYGVLFDPTYLAGLGLKPPETWSDLLAPGYAGHIGMTTPSRSGTTHLMVETILQRQGWARGWAMLSRLGGNLSTITARSFGVASGVAQRRFGIGPTIDFLAGLPGGSASMPVFVGVEPAILVPASIAVLARSQNVEAAEKFIEFLLSREGQLLLLDSAVKRIPVDPELAADLIGGPDAEGPPFDAALSADRYEIVNLIFDEFITRRRTALARLWAQLDALETADLGANADAALAAARTRLEAPPLGEDDVKELQALPRRHWQPSVARTAEQNAAVERLRSRVTHNLAEAERLLAGIQAVRP